MKRLLLSFLFLTSLNSYAILTPLAGSGNVDSVDGLTGVVVLSGKKDVEPRDFYAGSTLYPTVQSAIDAAELLPAADSSNSGILVHIPGGIFLEAVTIRKNISLVSLGNVQSTITSLTLRPYSNSIGPRNIMIRGITVTGAVVCNNETAPASGVFFNGMGSSQIQMEDSNFLSTLTSTNCNVLSYQGMYTAGTSTFTNTVGVYANFSTFGNVSFNVDSTASNLPAAFAGIESAGFIMRDGYAGNVTMNGAAASTKKATIQATNATINSITYATTNTKRNLVGMHIGSQVLTATPTTIANTMASIYTAGDAASWAGSAPVTQESAIDRISALVKTLNGGTAIP